MVFVLLVHDLLCLFHVLLYWLFLFFLLYYIWSCVFQVIVLIVFLVFRLLILFLIVLQILLYRSSFLWYFLLIAIILLNLHLLLLLIFHYTNPFLPFLHILLQTHFQNLLHHFLCFLLLYPSLYNVLVVFRTDRSEPNWDRCVIEVKNRFLRFSRDLLVRYRRSWACFDGGNEGYATKKRSPKSDYWIAR